MAGYLSTLRKQLYHSIISSGGLSAGDTQATNAQQAAIRLDGANELLDGYISLGLPQALASDDTLQGLVSCTNSDTFAPASGGLAGTAPASSVPAQVVNLYADDERSRSRPSCRPLPSPRSGTVPRSRRRSRSPGRTGTAPVAPRPSSRCSRGPNDPVSALGLQALHYDGMWLKTPIRGIYKQD